MTRGEFLKYATDKLASSSVPSARLDSLIIMEFVLGTDRAKLLATPGIAISPKQKNVLNRLLAKRAKHIPISYITHRTEFYGRSFYVNKYVLEPRPESETMIDQFKSIVGSDKALVRQASLQVADIGTGCGALGISAALEIKNIVLELIDIDQKALNVAKRNVVLHTMDAKVTKADLLPKTDRKYDVLICNLPYVPDDFQINLAASHEPRLAIFGGLDGLDIYRKLFKLLKAQQHLPLYILCESLPPSHPQLKLIAKEAGYNLTQTEDFISVFKLS